MFDKSVKSNLFKEMSARMQPDWLFGYEEKLHLFASGVVEYPLSHIPELARLVVGREEA